ncbi:MAG: glycosyl transferase [Pseudomonas sp. BICA1-14]|uniref:glycosyltransferase family 2 protein n=1 Tax=Stutzerimonas kunmingensis TaxID=1211807 RepID=UPI0005B36A3B|nr:MULTISPECIES: glycosyltransferase family 2 protein [Stutzerimonas stutzeri group]KJS80851.1 MAG: glycosyl transferase [[Pseudomonas] sp. BICA1-14]HBW09233.1 glycosyltransferase family 2 protein [Pseudomonas sp.]
MNPSEPLISIVIPAYNYALTLPRAVESVLLQLDDSVAELIVIDDGSSDETPHAIEALLVRHPGGFRALRKENGGAASARNRGIREARGEYLVFLDADDEMAPGALEALVQHIVQHPKTRMVIGGHDAILSNGRRRSYTPPVLPGARLDRLRGYLLDKRFALSNGACAMHRDVFSRGDYPEGFRSAEDIPVFSQVLAHYPCTVLARPLAVIHKHDDSLRHQFSHAKAGGLALVDEVFSPQRLDEEFQILKREFTVQRCLSLFRSAYLAGDAAAAKEYFRTALRYDRRVLLNISYTRKALRLWLGS